MSTLKVKETHTITTNQNIPDDIRGALKIREDLDGISGELLGYTRYFVDVELKSGVWLGVIFGIFWGAAYLANIVEWLGLLHGLWFWMFLVVLGVPPVWFGPWVKPKLTFTLGRTQCGFNDTHFTYTDIQHIVVVVVERLFEPDTCIQIRVAGKRAPVKVVLDYRMWREAEWIVNQIQARMAATQSGTVPEDLTRLTRQAGETASSTRPTNASSTQ